MNIIDPKVELVNPPEYAALLSTIESAGRTCYKSESKISTNSAETFIRNIINKGHEAVIEHGSITVRFTCDRGVSHEIVRHRLASYCQESTRYCNYAKDEFCGEITVIRPSWAKKRDRLYAVWEQACLAAEKAYFDLMTMGCTPQECRSVLPNSLKTELVMTANIREWRHFLKLRCSQAAHPDMRIVAKQAHSLLAEKYPVLFEDIEVNVILK